MVKIRFTSIKPGFVFEHKGVKLKAVEVKYEIGKCADCFFCQKSYKVCREHPCYINSIFEPKQRHNLIFKKVEDENSI